MDKTYEELLQETLSKIYELKDLDNRDRGKALTIFIGERLNRELLLSSRHIFTLYKDIINLDDVSLLTDLRKTDWYKDWFTDDRNNANLINLSRFNFKTLARFEKEEYLRDAEHYDFEGVIEVDSYGLFDTLIEDKDVELFKLAAENILINHGFFHNTDYNFYDVPDEYMEDKEVCAYMCLLNIGNMDFVDKKTLDTTVLYNIVKDRICGSIYFTLFDSLNKDTRTIAR
jgi:hypothetical protein|nr:MAG TPA: hypothetical protein [Caudoviricetes sp.]